jgi:hypothetical protein
MRWRGGRQSTNVDDRRGIGRGGVAVGGGLGAVVITILALLFGVDPSALLDQTGGGGGGPAPGAETRRGPAAPDDEMGQFIRVVLGTTEDTWNEIFRQQGSRYREPTLVLFSGQVSSACGRATASVGPFYCSGDEKLYIDLTFYRELKERFRAPGDFAQAYVIAHEVGHHVQHLTGAMEKVSAAQRRMSQAEGNRLSVRLELQADCYSGIWARHADQRGVVEPGDIDEALQAASAIGDDRLQKQSQGHVVPDSFTHGTSEQRARWFRVGYESGDARRCDTFAARSL